MTEQQFNLDFGRDLRDEGITQVSLHAGDWLWEGRRQAKKVVMQKGFVTSDDLQAVLILPAGLHHNAWGSILRAPWFRKAGEMQSWRPEAHARWIHKWVLGPKAWQL